MNPYFVKLIFSSVVFFLVSCGENTSSEKGFLHQAETTTDSLDFSKIEPLAISDSLKNAGEEEEFLAQNLEEESKKENDEDEFIKTELDEVVLSRKTPPVSDPFLDALGAGSGDAGPGSDEGMNGSGNGTVIRMERKIIDAPIIAPAGEEAIVSVEVIVNPGGTVMRTKLLLATQKTNTTNIKLHELALRYAKQYKFEADESLERNTAQVIHIHFTVD